MIQKYLVNTNTKVKHNVTGFSDLAIVKRQEELEKENGEAYEITEETEEMPDTDVLLLPVAFTSYTPLKDRGFNLKFHTPELTEAKLLHINRSFNQQGILLFRGVETLNKKDIEMIEKANVSGFEKGKSQGERIRNTLYLLWHQDTEGIDQMNDNEKRKSFSEYYNTKTEMYITHLKSKINN